MRYSCAFLVIPATASYDSTRGCFHEGLRTVEWEYENAAGEPARLCIQQSHDHSAFGGKAACAVVRTGEQYESETPVSRHLSFNEHGATRKDCLELGLCITQTPNWCSSALQRQTASAEALRNWHFDDTVLPRRVLTTSCRFGSSPTVPKISSSFAKIWQGVVESYSGKDLTYHTDKLPALAGLAKNFSASGCNLTMLDFSRPDPPITSSHSVARSRQVCAKLIVEALLVANFLSEG